MVYAQMYELVLSLKLILCGTQGSKENSSALAAGLESLFLAKHLQSRIHLESQFLEGRPANLESLNTIQSSYKNPHLQSFLSRLLPGRGDVPSRT